MGRIDIAEFVREQEARAAAESSVEEETKRRLQAESQLEETVALAEDATSKFETLSAELAAVQKGRGALLMEIEHQYSSCAEASARVEECEAEMAAAQAQVAELATCQEQTATLQIDLIVAAKLLDAASTGLATEKRTGAALQQQVELIRQEASRAAAVQEAEMSAWVQLGTKYGTRYGSIRLGSGTPNAEDDRSPDAVEFVRSNALTPWHTPGMARWPSPVSAQAIRVAR